MSWITHFWNGLQKRIGPYTQKTTTNPSMVWYVDVRPGFFVLDLPCGQFGTLGFVCFHLKPWSG